MRLGTGFREKDCPGDVWRHTTHSDNDDHTSLHNPCQIVIAISSTPTVSNLSRDRNTLPKSL